MPPIQKMILPCSLKKNTKSALRIRITRDHTITARGPKRSSSRPAMIVETPATRLRATPKIITSFAENPNDTAARIPPNAKTPARPSRYTALEIKNQNVVRC